VVYFLSTTFNGDLLEAAVLRSDGVVVVNSLVNPKAPEFDKVRREVYQLLSGELVVIYDAAWHLQSIADILGVDRDTISEIVRKKGHLSKIPHDFQPLLYSVWNLPKEERERRIIDLYLKAWNTQQSIADILGVPRQTVTDTINFAEKRHLSIFGKDFSPIIYSVWNLPKQDNDRKHFGAFPELFMENLLYYHTEPLDIVFDPFGGGGTTVDVCKRMFRRYYVNARRNTCLFA